MIITKGALAQLRNIIKGRGKKMQLVADEAQALQVIAALGAGGRDGGEVVRQVWVGTAATPLGDAACRYLARLGHADAGALVRLVVGIDDGRFFAHKVGFLDELHEISVADGATALRKLRGIVGDGTSDVGRDVLERLVIHASINPDARRALAESQEFRDMLDARAASEPRASKLADELRQSEVTVREPPVADVAAVLDALRAELPEPMRATITDAGTAAAALDDAAEQLGKVVTLLAKIVEGPIPTLSDAAKSALDTMGPNLSLDEL